MRTRTDRVAIASTAGAMVLVLSASIPAADHPWQQPYTGSNATGEDVLALWHFDAGTGLEDASGNGHMLNLRGQSRITGDGRFGSCLECFAAVGDNPEGAA